MEPLSATPNRAITKRRLGVFLMASALLVLVGLPWLGQMGLGEAGSGPAEQLARRVALLVLLIGATLLPLGDRPA